MFQNNNVCCVYFITLAWRPILVLRNKNFHEFVLTVLPRSLFSTLMDFHILLLSLNCLFSKILWFCVCACWVTSQAFFGTANYTILDNLWHIHLYLELPIFLSCYFLDVQLIEWANIFLFLQCVSSHNDNLICKHRGNCLLLLLHNIFSSFVVDVKMTLHPVFQNSFLTLGPIIGIHGSLPMLLSVFSVLGAWSLFI